MSDHIAYVTGEGCTTRYEALYKNEATAKEKVKVDYTTASPGGSSVLLKVGGDDAPKDDKGSFSLKHLGSTEVNLGPGETLWGRLSPNPLTPNKLRLTVKGAGGGARSDAASTKRG
jgi:hypothetical protein